MFEFFRKKEEINYGAMTPKELQLIYDGTSSLKKKDKIAEAYLQSLKNYENIKLAQSEILSSIFYSGFDPYYNVFLDFVLNFTCSTLTWPVARLIREIIITQKIKNLNCLYEEDLYKGSAEDVEFKVKAMICASNPVLQAGFSKKVTPMDFYINGKLMSAEQMRGLLDSIEVYE